MAAIIVAVGCSALVVAGFAAGCFLGLYAAGKVAPRIPKEEEQEASDKITIQEQIDNLFSYTGDNEWN